MNFNAGSFLLFFPCVFLLHWALPHRLRWLFLLLASWAFYLFWHPGAGALLIIVTAVSWLCARGISRTERRGVRRLLLGLALLASLGTLALFKYAGFLASLAGLSLPWKILLPAGISFYTFQTLSYVLDVNRGAAPEEHFGYYALFVAFFPQLVAGPIERAERLLPQLKAERTFRRSLLTDGGWLLLRGYFKKTVVADSLAAFVDPVFAAPGQALGPEVVLAVVLFGIQIYGDFSGYSDIARGCARLLGIDLMENFRRPYGATSVREFWRRWHISLTQWFRDYVYIPLGGNRGGLPRQIRNLLAVFLLSGLWHGAGWNFVLWGLLHGLFLTASLLRSRFREPVRSAGRLQRMGSQAVTFLLVSIPWLFFRAQSLADAGILLGRLATGWDSLGILLQGVWPLIPALLCLPLVEPLGEPETRPRSFVCGALVVFTLTISVCLARLSQAAGGSPNAFLYFQF